MLRMRLNWLGRNRIESKQATGTSFAEVKQDPPRSSVRGRIKNMNRLSSLAIGGLSLCLLVPSAAAQIASGSTNIADRVAQVILPDRISLDSPLAPVTSLRPPRPERPDLPLDIRQRLLLFEKLREAYLARQQDLLRKLRSGPTDDDRARIRAQLQALRQDWLERTRAFQEEATTRLRELPNELPKYRELLQDTRPDTVHKRRG